MTTEPIEVKVRCQHQMHRILLTPNEQLVLCDHAEPVEQIVDAARAARIVGHRIRCGDVMLIWRDRRDHCLEILPRGFASFRKEALRKHTTRWSGYPHGDVLSNKETTERRLEARTIAAVTEALLCTDYRRARKAAIQVSIGEKPRAKGIRQEEWGNRRWPISKSSLRVWVKRDWLFQVARKGLAVVDDKLVLEVLDRTPSGTFVRAVRQGRGYKVRADTAVIENGRLKWKRWKGV